MLVTPVHQARVAIKIVANDERSTGVPAATGSLAHFVHQGLEFVDVLEAAVHTGVADVGHLVELLEFAHDQLADTAGGHFALAEVEELLLDALDGRVDLCCAHRALAQRKAERAHELGACVFGASTVLLDHAGEADLGPLVGGKALFAGGAAAPAPDEIPVLGHPGLDDLCLVVAAERALHGRAGAWSGSAIDREAAGQRVDLGT